MLLRTVAVACALGTGACAIHPLPEDVTRVDTFVIVHQIRCEARDAIKDATAFFLSHFDPNDAYALESGAKLSAGMDFALLDMSRLGPKTQPYVLKYQSAAIAYDFTFDITEDNDLSTQVDLAGVISRGVLSVPIKAGNDRLRQTVRNFRVADNFGALRLYDKCGMPPRIANHVYPITGTIGLAEVVRTFIDLNENQNLTGTKDNDPVPVLADTFNFQTTISGSVAPKITLSPLRTPIDVAEASLSGAVLRKDIHKVIVAMSLPVEKPPAHTPAGRSKRSFGLFPGLQKTVPSASASSAKKRAVDELDFQIQKNILNNLVVRPN